MVWVVKLLLFQVHIHTETVWVARGPSTRDQPFWSSYNRTNKTKSCSTSTSNKTLSAAVCIYCQLHIFIFLFCIEATTLLFSLCEREKQNCGPNEHGIEEEQNGKNINRNKHNLKKKRIKMYCRQTSASGKGQSFENANCCLWLLALLSRSLGTYTSMLVYCCRLCYSLRWLNALLELPSIVNSWGTHSTQRHIQLQIFLQIGWACVMCCRNGGTLCLFGTDK